MSLERYSIGVDIDQSGINSGAEQMINTINNATNKMKESMTQMANSVRGSMEHITTTLATGSQQSTIGLTNSFNDMNTKISTGTSKASSSIQQSTQQMSSSLNSLQASLNGLNMGSLSTSTHGASDATNRLSTQMVTAASSTSVLGDKMRMLRQHLEWIATGAALGGIIGIPGAMIHAAMETENLTQKLRQNLELADQYHGNHQLLEGDLGRLNAAAQVFAVGYGASLGEVMDSMQILSRRFKDVESISYLTSAALTMNKLDAVDLRKASSDLEAVMLQFGLTAKGTQQFVNDFSIAVHTARINGTDLLDALQRSGSGFKQFNMGSREAIAAISALSTETARTGSTIGNTMKSITANFSMDKAVTALKTYDIQLYDTNENGLKTMRAGANVFAELQTLYARLDDEGKAKLSLAIAGGKFQVNAMSAFLADANKNFSSILKEMETKSSNEMTKQLLQASMDTFSSKLKQAQASLTVFAKILGDKVLPMLKRFADMMTASVIWLTQHSEAIAGVLGWVSKLGAAYLALRAYTAAYAVATALVTTYTTLQAIASATLMGTTALLTAGTWGQSLAIAASTVALTASTIATEGLAAGMNVLFASMGPIGWATLSITALGASIYVVYNNWEPILIWMQETWNKVVNLIADNIMILLAIFPVLGATITIIAALWEPIIQWMHDRWAGFVNFFYEVKAAIIKIIDSVCEAMPKFATAAGSAVSNMVSIFSNLVYDSLPQFGKDFINFFVNLYNKVNEITTKIGNMIRKNLTVGVNTAVGGVAEGGKSPYDLAVELANQSAEVMSMQPGGGGAGDLSPSTPDMANQLSGKKAKGPKDKKGRASETDYAVAKREYESEIADEELTAAQKIEIYKRLLEGKAVGEKELHDYTKGLGRLEVADIKEKRALAIADLEREVAEGKEQNHAYYAYKIRMIQEEVDQAKAGSVEQLQIQKRLAEAKKELVKFDRGEAIQLLEQEKQLALEKLEMVADQNKKLAGLYQLSQEEYTRSLLQGSDDRYRVELDALERKKLAYGQDLKEINKIQTEITKLNKDHAKSRLAIEAELFKEQNKYQLAGLDGFRTGMAKVLNGLLQWNMSIKTMIREMGKSVLSSVADVWVKGMVDNMSKGIAKMLGLTTVQKTKETAAEESKQAALTSVAAAGESTRLLAMKTSITAANAAGAAGATAMVGATTAAFTATFAMIEATAAAIATILPAGPGIAAAITAGVTAGTATLTAAGATATASIAGLAVPSFDVGAWKIGQDTLAQVHEGETIIPKEPAQKFRDAVSDGTFGNAMNGRNNEQSAPPIINLTASAVDTRGLKPLVRNMGRDLVDTLAQQKRGFNVGKRRW